MASSNLQPEKRTDKNGVAVTRHVKAAQASAAASGLAGLRPPAPVREGRGSARRGFAEFDFDAEPAEGYEPPTVTTTRGKTARTTVGSKHGPGSPRAATEIAKAVRADVKAAIAAGWLPDGLKYSVTTSKAVRTQSVLVSVSGLPDDMIYAPEANEYWMPQLSAYASALGERLHRLVEAYNSASMPFLGDSSYNLYYSGVGIKDARQLQLEAEEAERNRLAREERIQRALSDQPED